MIPDLSKLDLQVLALKSRVLLSDELCVSFIVDNDGIISPIYDCAVLDLVSIRETSMGHFMWMNYQAENAITGALTCRTWILNDKENHLAQLGRP